MRLEGYSDYEIYPETGQIFSYKRNRFLKIGKRRNYSRVEIVDDMGNPQCWSVHRLIWTVVNGEIPDGMQVNHIDENKNNNSISNLNLMTPKENTNWGTRNERAGKNVSKALKGKYKYHKHPRSKVIIQFTNNGTLLRLWKCCKSASEKYNIPQSNISQCLTGNYKQAGGYKWRYLDDVLGDWLEEIQDEDMKNERVA